MVVDSLISATKVFEGKTQVCGRVWLSCCTKIFCASHKNVSCMFSLGDCALEDQLILENWICRSSFSGILALNQRPIFEDKKVIIAGGKRSPQPILGQRHSMNCIQRSHDVTAAILVSQNNEIAAMLVFHTNPVGVELFCNVNTFFCSNKFA